MRGPRGWIACGWRAQSTPFPCRFRPESGRWNPNVPPCRLGGALYEVLRKSRLCPQTSSHDRFAPATRGFRFSSCLRSACDRRYRFPEHTSECPVRSRPIMACTASETNETCRLFPDPVARSRTELRWKGLCAVLREVSERRRDGKHARENRRLVLRLETVRYIQEPHDLRKWLSHPD